MSSGTREKSGSGTREKSGSTREKFGTEGKIRSQVVERAGAGWTGPGGGGPGGAGGPGGGGPGGVRPGRAGQPWRGGRACWYIKSVRRNRIECRFGAEKRG